MDAVYSASRVMNKNNHGVFLAKAVSHILTEIKLHQQLVHRKLGMIFKQLEPGHQDVCLSEEMCVLNGGRLCNESSLPRRDMVRL